MNSRHKINHKSFKTTPIIKYLTHDISLVVLNKHMCCDLQMIARTHQSKKGASLPELRYMHNCRHIQIWYLI